MAALDPDSLFQKWILNDEEKKYAPILTITQKQHLQNILVMSAAEKVHLPRTAETLQREAELHGWILCIQHILALSDQAQAALEKENSIHHGPSGNITPPHNPLLGADPLF